MKLFCLRQERHHCGVAQSPVYAGRVHGVQPHVQHLSSLGQLTPTRQGRISLQSMSEAFSLQNRRRVCRRVCVGMLSECSCICTRCTERFICGLVGKVNNLQRDKWLRIQLVAKSLAAACRVRSAAWCTWHRCGEGQAAGTALQKSPEQ